MTQITAIYIQLHFMAQLLESKMQNCSQESYKTTRSCVWPSGRRSSPRANTHSESQGLFDSAVILFHMEHTHLLLQTKRWICKFLQSVLHVRTDVSSTDMQMSIRCRPAFIHKAFNIWADLRSGLHYFHSICAATSHRPQALSDIWRTPAQTDPLQ